MTDSPQTTPSALRRRSAELRHAAKVAVSLGFFAVAKQRETEADHMERLAERREATDVE